MSINRGRPHFDEVWQYVDTEKNEANISGNLTGGRHSYSVENGSAGKEEYSWSVNFWYSDSMSVSDNGEFSIQSNGGANSANVGYLILESDVDIDNDCVSDLSKSFGFVDYDDTGL